MNKKTILTILLAVLLFPLGAEAKKKAKDEAVPQLTNYPSATLDEQLFQGGDVVLKEHIAGLPENDIPEEGLAKINGRLSVIMHDYVTNRKERSVIEFGSNGTFSLNIHVPHPMFLFIHPTSMVYACLGDTLEKCRSFLEPNNIKGEHIHVTQQEWGYLSEKFNFSGIPFIVLFDKQGKQRDDTDVEHLLKE